MSSELDCLSVGILVADHLCSPIPKSPDAGELILADSLPLTVGGCAANTAIDLARLGLNVGVVGCVGGDVFGRFVIETLAAAKLNTSGVRTLPTHETSGTLIINVSGQDRRFVHARGANAAFSCDHLDWEQIRRAKVLYLGGYLLMPALVPEELGELFRRAREAGVKTVLDVVLPGAGDHLSLLKPVLKYTDIFLPNIDESRAITGLDDPVRQAETFRDAGADTVVITCGDEGSVLLSQSTRVRAGIFPMEYVGGTGSGDAFDAGYIMGLIQGLGPVDCLRWGSALGASCVRAIGATQSVFNRAEAEAFLREHELAIEAL